MADLTTTYLGLKLPTPIVISSNPLTADIDHIQHMEQVGVGAIILPSLFEEQLTLEDSGLNYYRRYNSESIPPALRDIPDMQQYNKGASGYLAYIYQAKKRINIPIIASLNGTSKGGWLRHAQQLISVGADAIELNIYHLPTELYLTGEDVEGVYLRLVEALKKNLDVPIAVKLSPYFSAIPNFTKKLADVGADGVVFFNRFYQPDFDIDNELVMPNLQLSQSHELLLRLRWVAILYEQIPIEFGVTGGVHTGSDVIKTLLAGGTVAMMASAILKHGVDHVSVCLAEIQQWMERHEYTHLGQVRGRMSQRHVANPTSLERANYMHVLQSYAANQK
ncbi:MAG TPA: dihydroorotate dehydrogenase-like protein [Anaerolineae bacterium]|nr:dihydroorotate dehydrogenase-like protein [Anaerolineae bacterium]